MTHLVPLAGLLLALLAGCAAPPPPSPPTVQPVATAAPPPPASAAPAAIRPCVIVLGGSIGVEYRDPNIARFWFEANRQVTDALYQGLNAQRVHAVPMVIAVEQRAQTMMRVAQVQATSGCQRVLQLANHAGEDHLGPFFRWDVELFELSPSPRGGHTTRLVHSRQYRYAHQKSSFDQFHTGRFAEQVRQDLNAAGVWR